MDLTARDGDLVAMTTPTPGLQPPAAADGAGDATLDELIRNLGRAVGAETVLLYALDGQGAVAWALPRHGPAGPGVGPGRPPAPADGPWAQALRVERAFMAPLHEQLDADLVAAGDGRPLTDACIAPIRVPGRTAGVLIAAFGRAPTAPEQVVWLAECHAQLIALRLHAPERYRELVDSGRVDGLTGCLTFDSIRLELVREVNRSARGDAPLTCCFVDVDDFKRINDGYGHPRGNDALATVGRTLRRQIRSCDTVGRYGGDEFVVILPQTTSRQARAIAGRLQQQLAATPLPSLPGEHLTASVGIAQWRSGNSAEELLTRADDALLRHKARRRREPLAGVSRGRLS